MLCRCSFQQHSSCCKSNASACYVSAWTSLQKTEFFGVFRLSAEARARGEPICAYFGVLRHTSQAESYVEILFGKADMIFLPMCEHPWRILADSGHSFEADLGREDCPNRAAQLPRPKQLAASSCRQPNLSHSRRIKHHQATEQVLP